MMTVVTVNPMPIIPVVPGAVVIAIGPIGSIIPIRVIAIVIAIPIGRITKSNTYAPDSH